MSRVRTKHLVRKKIAGEKIPVLTAYDATMTRLLERAGIEVLLVGDSVGMTMLGYENTVPVTMADMLHHTKAVSRAATTALVIADMPFLSYQLSETEALRNAGQLLAEGGAAAVKFEGAYCEVVRKLVDTGIPVMGHLGLLPQQVHQLGGFHRQARTEASAQKLLDDAVALEQAGVFSIVLECIPHALADEVTKRLTVPTIGIGAGPNCDGQVLVSNDLFGFTAGAVPPFVKPYLRLGQDVVEAASAFAADVISGRFPETD